MEKRWPILLTAAGLCAAGVLRIWGEGRDGYMLAAAGLVLIGAWLAMEIRDRDGK